MKITHFTTENLQKGCVTDRAQPRFSFAVEDEKNGAYIKSATLTVNGWKTDAKSQILIPYGGAPLKPFTKYEANLSVTDGDGKTCSASTQFSTGRMNSPWQAKWITDGMYKFTEKRVSPTPMAFRKQIKTDKKIAKAAIYCTALGIYKIEINGKKAGDEYFAPGFTSYKTTLHYQTYDVTQSFSGNDEIIVTVAGGWAVGSFVFTRKNRITAPRQALLMELRITFDDGSEQVIGTDESWDVTRDGCYRAADFYDGEVYDASVRAEDISWRKAAVEKIKISPKIIAATGSPVRAHEKMTPVSYKKVGDEIIYDFGQNFAGVICVEINGKNGQKITFRHAEVLKNDGTLFCELLRTAKACVEYTCRDGGQFYSPEFTYMGFRYVGVSGIEAENIKLTAVALYSDMEQCGHFSCSDERINKLQSNIVWSSKSNFMDIPTDCPQRDERMGWTGDIAVFAPAACYNFDTSRFFDKWLCDVRSEQLKTGGIPNTVPVQGYGFPATMPVMAVDFWGDACVLVPWAEYMARGDIGVLEANYAMMKKYVKACKFWAGLLSFGKKRYIWKNISALHFGDWVAPDAPKMSQWQARHKYTATASLAHTSGLLAQIAKILHKEDDAKYYSELSARTADAYVSVLSDGKGTMNDQFQTAYVLPLAFKMFPDGQREAAAENLAKLVRANNYRIGTGFPGTPYILFALADNGKQEEAFKVLTCDENPSWLYEVKAGATTIWERWDGLNEDGSVKLPNDGTDCMISFNHYASGAVGDFLYRRVAGIEATESGYKTFKIQPMMGGGITSANGSVCTPYGKIESGWRLSDGAFELEISVPVGTTCEVILPDGTEQTAGSGRHKFNCNINN